MLLHPAGEKPVWKFPKFRRTTTPGMADRVRRGARFAVQALGPRGDTLRGESWATHRTKGKETTI